MSICKKCGIETADGAELCAACQSPSPEAESAVQPESVAQTEEIVQEVSEAPADAPTAPATLPVDSTSDNASEPPKKKSSKKGVIIGVAVAVVALLAAAVAFFLFKGEEVHNYVLYVKDGSIYYTELEKIEPLLITDDAIDYNDDFEESIFNGLYISGYVELTKDYKTAFYPYDYTYKDLSSSFDLRYRTIADSKDKGTEVDSDVKTYRISEDNTTIIYTKADDEDTYVAYKYDVKSQTKEKLFDDIKSIDISEDFSKVMYKNNDENLYIYDIATDSKEKIDSDVVSVEYYAKDFSTVYYIKETEEEKELYKKVSGSDTECVVSDVHDIIKIYETGEIYYLTKEETSIPYSALFTDDKLEEDKKYGEFSKKKDILNHYSAYCRYLHRGGIEGQEIEKDLYSLHYVSAEGKKKEIATNVTSNDYNFTYKTASEKPVIVFNSIDMDILGKLKMSEIDFGTIDSNFNESKEFVEIYTILRETVEKNYLDSHMLKVAVGDTVTDIDATNVYDIDVSNDGTEISYISHTKDEPKKDDKRDYDAEWSEDVYYIEDDTLYLNHEDWGVDYSNEDEGELFRVTIAEDNTVSKPEAVDKKVNLFNVFYTGENKKTVYYFKNYDKDENTVDLYINGESIIDDIYSSDIIFCAEDKIYYMTDYDIEDKYGTLMYYNGEEEIQVAQDVSAYVLSDGGDLLFLSDYSDSKSRGSLYIYRGKENELIDKDVTAIIPTNLNFTGLW